MSWPTSRWMEGGGQWVGGQVTSERVGRQAKGQIVDGQMGGVLKDEWQVDGWVGGWMGRRKMGDIQLAQWIYGYVDKCVGQRQIY